MVDLFVKFKRLCKSPPYRTMTASSREGLAGFRKPPALYRLIDFGYKDNILRYSLLN